MIRELCCNCHQRMTTREDGLCTICFQTDQITALKAELEEARRDTIVKYEGGLQRKIEEQQAEIDRLKKALEVTNELAAVRLRNLEKAQAEIERLKAEVKSLEGDVEHLWNSRSELEKEKNAEIERLKGNNAALLESNKVKHEQINALLREIKKLKKEQK